MSKVLLPTIDFPPQQGGVARYLGALKKTLGEDVEVVYWTTHLTRWEMFREILQWSRDYRQIWTSHILPIGTMTYLVKKMAKTPYVVFLHGMDFDLARRNRWKRWLTKRILRNAKRVVTNSHALAAEVTKFADIPSPLVVQPALADSFVKAGEGFEYHEKLLNRPGRVQLLTVSRLVQRKGHIKVLEAIRDLPNVEYHIVGDGSWRNRIQMRVKDLNLQDRVFFHGEVSDEELIKLYKSSDIFVMPTTKTELDREGFGIVYLEAQLFDMPVIASKHPGVDEAVMDRVTGYLVTDISSLRAAIHRLVTDKELRQRMGEAGRQYVLAGFTREKQFTQLDELI